MKDGQCKIQWRECETARYFTSVLNMQLGIAELLAWVVCETGTLSLKLDVTAVAVQRRGIDL